MENQEIIFVVEESLEGGYEARALGHSIFTQGETLEELRTYGPKRGGMSFP